MLVASWGAEKGEADFIFGIGARHGKRNEEEWLRVERRLWKRRRGLVVLWRGWKMSGTCYDVNEETGCVAVLWLRNAPFFSQGWFEEGGSVVHNCKEGNFASTKRGTSLAGRCGCSTVVSFRGVHLQEYWLGGQACRGHSLWRAGQPTLQFDARRTSVDSGLKCWKHTSVSLYWNIESNRVSCSY